MRRAPIGERSTRLGEASSYVAIRGSRAWFDGSRRCGVLVAWVVLAASGGSMGSRDSVVGGDNGPDVSAPANGSASPAPGSGSLYEALEREKSVYIGLMDECKADSECGADILDGYQETLNKINEDKAGIKPPSNFTVIKEGE